MAYMSGYSEVLPGVCTCQWRCAELGNSWHTSCLPWSWPPVLLGMDDDGGDIGSVASVIAGLELKIKNQAEDDSIAAW